MSALTVADIGIDFRAAILAEVWRAVNAQGGEPQTGDLYEAGFCAGIDAALDEIERLGGRDPAMLPFNFAAETSNQPEHRDAA